MPEETYLEIVSEAPLPPIYPIPRIGGVSNWVIGNVTEAFDVSLKTSFLAHHLLEESTL